MEGIVHDIWVGGRKELEDAHFLQRLHLADKKLPEVPTISLLAEIIGKLSTRKQTVAQKNKICHFHSGVTNSSCRR